jgi:hypothetical protein
MKTSKADNSSGEEKYAGKTKKPSKTSQVDPAYSTENRLKAEKPSYLESTVKGLKYLVSSNEEKVRSLEVSQFNSTRSL